MIRRALVLLVVLGLGVGTASAGTRVSLHRYRWNHTHEYVTVVPLRHHAVAPVLAPARAFPLIHMTPKRRLAGKRAVAGTNEDFSCKPNKGHSLPIPHNMLMVRREIWTTGVFPGYVYEQGIGHAWVQRAHIQMHIGSEPVVAVNPCTPKLGPSLYTLRGGRTIHPPVARCYTKVYRVSDPYWGKHKRTSRTNYRIGRSVCRHDPLPRPEVVSNFKLSLPRKHRVAFRVNMGHRGVSAVQGGSWLSVKGGHNVAPSHAQGKDCGINTCPDGYMLGRTPRTALCVAHHGRTAYVVVADGKPGNAAGLTPPMLGKFGVRRVHAAACLNLDGGGSSVLLWHGRQVSHPSYGTERPVIFATAVFKR